jgi:hypothetical protein
MKMKNKNNTGIVAYALALANTYHLELPYLCYSREQGWYSSFLPGGLISAAATRKNGVAMLRISDYGYLMSIVETL